MSDLRVETIPPPWDGWDTDSSPGRIAPTRSPLVRNVLTDHAGMVRQRGPLIYAGYATVSTDTDSAMIGYIHKGETKLGFQRNTTINTDTVTPLGFLEPHVLPLVNTGDPAHVAGCSGNLWYDDAFEPFGGQGSPTSFANATTRGGRAELATGLGSYTYVPGISNYASDPATTGTNGNLCSTAPILRWNGAMTVPTAITVQAKGALAVRAHLNRLFALAGLDVINGGTQVELNSLYWTDPSATDLSLAVSWKNAVSGLANKITVDSENPDDFGVALAKVGNYLCILKRRSIHMLFGSTSDTFSVRTISNGIGCMDARSVVEYEGGIFFLSEQGYMHFDGTRFVNVSENIQSRLLPVALDMVGAAGDYNVGGSSGPYIRVSGIPISMKPGGFATAERIPGNNIMLSIGSYAIPQAAGITEYSNRFWALYDVDRQTWTEVSTDADVVDPSPVSFYRSPTRVGFLDKHAAFDLEKFATPERQGYDAVTPGGLDVGAIAGVLSSPTAGRPIPSQVSTRWFKLGTPGDRAQAHRVLVDYRMITDESPISGAWTVYVEDQDGNNLTGNVDLPVPTDGTNASDRGRYIARSRHAFDLFTEANEVRVVAEWSPTYSNPNNPPSLNALELHDVSIEYQSSRQRPSAP